MPMKTFIESYLCPSLRIALAGFCIGRSSECFSCKGIGPSMEQKWTYTKCKPNRELMNHQICSHGKCYTTNDHVWLMTIWQMQWNLTSAQPKPATSLIARTASRATCKMWRRRSRRVAGKNFIWVINAPHTHLITLLFIQARSWHAKRWWIRIPSLNWIARQLNKTARTSSPIKRRSSLCKC